MTGTRAFEAPEHTIGHSILEAARRWPTKTAFVFGDQTATFEEFARQTIACSRSLMVYGVQAGDHVGILMPNCWAYAILVGAINLIGACAVVLNARYRGEELRYVVERSDLTLLFTTGSARPHLDLRAAVIQQFPELAQWRAGDVLRAAAAPKLRGVFHFDAPDETRWPTDLGFDAAGASVSDDALRARIESVSPDSTALIIFSSGTTAQPKACLLSHRTVSTVADDITERLELNERDVLWDPLPLYHLSSHLPINACRRVGATFVCQNRFEAAEALEEIERVGATIIYPAFPAVMASLLDHRDFPKRDFSKVRMMINIGAPELLRKFSQALPQARQISCYGLTESGGICSMSSPHDSLEQRVARTGRPLRSHRVRIVNPETLEEAPAGSRGEIVIGGPLFSGYYGDPAQTQKVMLPGGWLRSGDLGWIDEAGQIVYAGRHKDMLKIGGENVAAVEVESHLSRHPKIKMAVVIPAPDPRLSEVVAAYIELRAGETMSVAEVIQYCVGQLASFKVPRYVRFVTSWPMSATKIQKFKLIEEFVPEGKVDIDAFRGRASRTA